MKVKFKQWNCVLEHKTYENGRPALVLVNTDDRQPVATATVNLPEVTLQEGYVHIKEWSEGEGMTQALIDASVVTYTGLKIPVGPHGSYANLCKLIIHNGKK